MRKYNNISIVEIKALEQSGKKFLYPPTEKIKIIEVEDFPSLGKLAALRFLEWIQLNPEGVISLPTGKTPEYFIKWVLHFLKTWNNKQTQNELGIWGLNEKKKPDMRSFPFVQIDEFYPMNPDQENSFAFYIQQFYFKGFGLDRKKALLMDTWETGTDPGHNLSSVFPEGKVDLSLRYQKPANTQQHKQYKAICAMDQFAMEYESHIEKLGGIGFFLGGIGPDGHIGFNIRISDHFSTTRLSPINYETAATAAVDLGGIEIARNKAVITIGLKTITKNETSTAVIIATGETKTRVVRDAVEKKPSVQYPATALHKLSAARFYLTKGAASELIERRCETIRSASSISYEQSSRILIDTSLKKGKKLTELTEKDLKADKIGSLLLHGKKSAKKLAKKVSADIEKKMLNGVKEIEGLRFLHTGPHHDDIMLGYMPYILHLVRKPKNTHYFATMTSGFTSVSNNYIFSQLGNLETHLAKGLLQELIEEKNYFNSSNIVARNRDVFGYLDGVAHKNLTMQKESESRRMMRNMTEVFEINDVELIKQQIRHLKDYLNNAYPGKKDIPAIQKLKGLIREWEEELLWAHLGFNCSHIFHLRLGFYTGDIFTPELTWNRDVKPVLNLLKRINPDILTVALDPEGAGPDTHYKVLQITSEAVREFLKDKPKKKLTIWGYRNVWHRFHPAETDIFVPVSMNSLAIMQEAFRTCFGSQTAASFPSYEYDGPFSDLAQNIMVDQYSKLKTCLGRDFFYDNQIPRLRATRGLVLLKSMSADEFLSQARTMKKFVEGII